MISLGLYPYTRDLLFAGTLKSPKFIPVVKNTLFNKTAEACGSREFKLAILCCF